MGNTTSEMGRPLNATDEASCTEQLIASEWNKLAIVISFVVLGLINVMVILGNTLVIMAVFFSAKLRTVTNLFIVSLAVSDLMVGIAVLPFSTVYEVLELWIFGNIWCQIWLAVDVWMCTASILNLCAISLDRYVAVTRPVSYPSIMSSKRAKILIAIVWCVSFVICLPPLVGWSSVQPDDAPSAPVQSYAAGGERNEDVAHQARYLQSYHFATVLKHDEFQDTLETVTSRSVHDMEELFEGSVQSGYDYSASVASNVSDAASGPSQCACQLTTDKGYRIYSALGSFYLPMLVMMFFYCRIYRAAVETTRAINQGFRTTKSGSGACGGRFEEQRLTLRIHRGRSSSELCRKSNGACDSGVSFRGGSRRVRNSSFRESPSRVERAGIGGMTFPPSSDKKVRALIKTRQRAAASRSTSSGNVCSRLNPSRRRAQQHWTTRTAAVATCANCAASDPSRGGEAEDASAVQPPSIPPSEPEASDRGTDDQYELEKKGPQAFSRMGKRNIKAQVKRFRNETKAAKTLGIIVGGFILCWLPFFTIYLTAAFCADDCIPKALFAVFFWLGYCNSAINPCVYALFSRDFRHAFQRILCRCFIKKDHSVKQRIVTMFPASLHLASFFEESEEGSNSY